MYKQMKNVQRVRLMRLIAAPNRLNATGQWRELAYHATEKANESPEAESALKQPESNQNQHDPISPLSKVWRQLEIQLKHTEKEVADQRFKAMMNKIEKCLSKAKLSVSKAAFFDVKRPIKPTDKVKKVDNSRKDTHEELKCLSHKVCKEKETTEKLHKLMQLEVEQREKGYPTEVKASRALNPPKNINYVI